MQAIIFDTETTALIDNHTVKIDKQPHVIEFYGCLADLATGEIKKELHHLVKPPIEITQEITNITTIRNEDVAEAPTFDKVANEIFAFVEAGPLIIAHNLSYDKEMLELEAERLSRTIAWPRLICSVEQTISLKGYHLSLTDLHQYLFGEPFAGAHRANVDTAALLRCCVELYKRDIL